MRAARWVGMTALGELVGFGLVGLAAPFLLAGSEEPGIGRLLVFSIVAALLEGSVLAYAQWRVLRGSLPIAYRAWAVATIAPAALAYALGMLLGPRLGTSGLPLPWILVLALALALLMGALLGAGQWLVLRTRADRAGAWIPLSALAWTGGLALAVGGVSLASDATAPWAMVALAALSGVAMGLFVGLVTSVAYVRLAPRGAGGDALAERTRPPRAALERWSAVLLLAASLVALAAMPGASGLAAAALMWIVGFALFEDAKRPAA